VLTDTSVRVAEPSASVWRPGPRLEALLGLLLVPIAVFFGVCSAVWRFLVGGRRKLAATPRLEIGPGPEPLRDVASFAAAVQSEEVPWRSGFGMMDFELVYASDIVSSTLDARPRLANRYFRCPAPFRMVSFESLDGTPLVAEVAARDDRDRPGLVVVHGTFGASDQAIYGRPAIVAFEEWGFNVAVVNMRGWGRSAALSDTPMTGGWREAEDVLAAARYLLENTRTTTVGAIGYSLGGASVLLAAAHERAPELLASGVFSESGYTDAREVAQIVEGRPGPLERRFLMHWLFRFGFSEKFRAMKLGRMSILEYFEGIAAPFYGVDVDELYDRDSVIQRVGEIRVPAFQLHAVDDWIVPVGQAEALRAEAARTGNHLVGVCIRERGAHCAFARVARDWRDGVARRFFAATSGVSVDGR
jgi:predicted alpha/beta-fold hydrolase